MCAYQIIFPDKPPAYWPNIITEVAGEFTGMFGERARDGMVRGLNGLFSSSADLITKAVLVDSEQRLTALWVSRENQGFHEVNLLHATQAMDRAAAALLVDQVVKVLRQQGARGILMDTPNTGPDIWEEAFDAQGFHSNPRSLQQVALRTLPNDRGELDIRPVEDIAGLGQLSECMVDAYSQSPDRIMHPEMHDLYFSRRHLNQAWKSGAVLLCLWQGNQCVAGLCCESPAPENAFLMHLFVRPGHRRRGYATRLLARLKPMAAARWNAERLWLCVSKDNPAQALYDRMGFEYFRAQTAHYWYHTDYLRQTGQERLWRDTTGPMKPTPL